MCGGCVVVMWQRSTCDIVSSPLRTASSQAPVELESLPDLPDPPRCVTSCAYVTALVRTDTRLQSIPFPAVAPDQHLLKCSVAVATTSCGADCAMS